MIYENPLAEILSLHNFKTNRSLAEALCYTFNSDIKCGRPINIKLFSVFAEYEPLYVFSHRGAINDTLSNQPITLQGVEITVPPGKEEVFMHKTSNFIFYGSSDSSINWLDDENGYEGVYGKCQINF